MTFDLEEISRECCLPPPPPLLLLLLPTDSEQFSLIRFYGSNQPSVQQPVRSAKCAGLAGPPLQSSAGLVKTLFFTCFGLLTDDLGVGEGDRGQEGKREEVYVEEGP